jgi:hypothetical protein
MGVPELRSALQDLTSAARTLLIDKCHRVRTRVGTKDHPPTSVACHRHISAGRSQENPVWTLEHFELMRHAS